MAKTRLTPTQKAEIDTLVKRANQRLRELEKSKYVKSNAYERVKFYQSKNVPWISTDSKGRVKFATNVQQLYKQDKQSYYDLKRYAEEFLSRKSSKAGFIKERAIKGQESIKEKYGVDIPIDTIADIFHSELYKEMLRDTNYGSDTVLEIMRDSGSDNADDLMYIIEKLKENQLPAEIERALQDPKRKKKGF